MPQSSRVIATRLASVRQRASSGGEAAVRTNSRAGRTSLRMRPCTPAKARVQTDRSICLFVDRFATLGNDGEVLMAEVQRSSLTRVIASSLIGTTIEWYDFFLYGSAAALVFNKLFFPSFDPLVGTLLAFATYAVGFVARPLGGIVFGHFGDRIGRKKLLMWSLVMMGLATLLIGLLPGYGSIGVWAPIGLIVLRVLQGFAVGGEWGGAVLMAAEHGDARRRGYWASWPQAGVPLGSLLSAGILALMAGFQSEADFIAWGWRVPFLLSAVLVVIGWVISKSNARRPKLAAAIEGAR